MKAWLASDLSELDLLVIQIGGLHVGYHVLMAAIGVDGNGTSMSWPWSRGRRRTRSSSRP